MPRPALDIQPCPLSRRAEALAFFLGDETEIRADLVDALGDGPDDPRLWIAQRGDRLEGVILAQRLAGAAAAVWPPRVRAGWGRAATAGRLVRAALQSMRTEGAQLAQSLVGPGAPATTLGDLTRGGLPYVTDLLSMSRPTASPPLDPWPETPTLVWTPFHEVPRPRFDAIIEATYVASRDMPELKGLRRLDDLIASQHAAGRFEPGLWQIGQIDGEPAAAAVLLLADVADRQQVEIVYLGLTPEARHRGLGRSVLARAVELARPRQPTLELAVDVRNRPALRLYRETGFRVIERRAVHLRVLDSPPQGS